jgi:hypothetical protein
MYVCICINMCVCVCVCVCVSSYYYTSSERPNTTVHMLCDYYEAAIAANRAAGMA